uniref:Uncharacterized protein n=1 Tax=Junco hyemalis TaxID=40217 RepID=A0A8C5ILE8_JUNHY
MHQKPWKGTEQRPLQSPQTPSPFPGSSCLFPTGKSGANTQQLLQAGTGVSFPDSSSLHREVLQHLVEYAAIPKFTLVSGQSAEHFLVMRCPTSLPGRRRGEKGELGFRILLEEAARGEGLQFP